MIRLTKEQILSIYRMLIDKTGGSPGVIKAELYPTLEEKGARLGYSLVSNHSFRDGNKRIGVLTMLTFLSVNEIEINCTDTEIVETGFTLASGLMGYETLFSWLTKHCDAKNPCRDRNTKSR